MAPFASTSAADCDKSVVGELSGVRSTRSFFVVALVDR